ncbi:polysaccharide pyruvyl transferase family protein [Dokdonia ponticola]|uniref:Polysaccharide pyruvyl transferase family protein n=1 Tax=Dokdonia ponticola TaxID=2041041 RepID=A0ABV9HUY1_9FLAO
MDKPTIIVKGAYGQPNFGDDLLMLVLKNILEKSFFDSKYKFLIPPLCNYIEDFLEPEHILYNQGDNIEVDYLILGGGTQFYSFPDTKKNARIAILRSILKNPLSLKLYLKKRKQASGIKIEAKKIIGVGLGIGPFEGKEAEIAKKNTIKTLSKMAFLMVRDTVSYRLAKQNKINNNLILANDLCFAPKAYLPFNVMESSTNEKTKITFILRDWGHSKNKVHIERTIAYIKGMLSANKADSYNVLLFAKDADCKSLLEKNNIMYIQWSPKKYSIQDFINIMKSTDIIISSRYHGIVLSSLFNIPFIPIVVDPKLSIFAAAISSKIHLWEYPFVPSDLHLAIEQTLLNKEGILEDNIEKNNLYNNQLEEVISKLKQFIYEEN